MMGPIKFVYLIGQSAVAFAIGWLGMTIVSSFLTGVLMIPELTQLAYNYGHLLSAVVGILSAYRFGGFAG